MKEPRQGLGGTVPGARAPLPADLVGAVRGERLVVANPDGCHYGYRGWSDVFTAPDGHSFVEVVDEEEWWAHKLLGATPSPQRWPSRAVWVE